MEESAAREMGACGVVVFVMLHIDISSAKQTHSRHVCVYEMNGQKVCVCVCVCVCQGEWTGNISTFHRFNVFISGSNGVLLIKKGNFPNHFSQLIILVHLSFQGLMITSPWNLLPGKWEVT